MFPSHLNATTGPPPAAPQSHATAASSGESVALFTVVTLFGLVFLVIAMVVWFCLPSALEGEEAGGTLAIGSGHNRTRNDNNNEVVAAVATSAASLRQEKELARLEYVHKVLRTRSWHGAVARNMSIHKKTEGSDTDNHEDENDDTSVTIATVPSGDSGDGYEDDDIVAPHPRPETAARQPDPEAGISLPRGSGGDDDRQAVPPPVPVSPCGSFDSECDDGDDFDVIKLDGVNVNGGNHEYSGGLLDECAICLTHFVESEQVCQSSNPRCTHLFHPECLEPWLVRHEGCPVCREAYLVEASTAPPSPSSNVTREREREQQGGRTGGRASGGGGSPRRPHFRRWRHDGEGGEGRSP